MDRVRKARLAKLIASRYKGDRAQLITESGLSGGRISQLLDPKEVFGERAARNLERKLGLPERWLDVEEVTNTEPGPAIREGIPLISWIQAGSWAEAVEPYHHGDIKTFVPSLKPTSTRAFALRVRGDSMTSPYGRSYPEGSIIIVEPDRRMPVNGERIIAKLEGSNEVTFKVYKEEDARRWLQPLNPSHEPIREPFKVLGTVVGTWIDE